MQKHKIDCHHYGLPAIWGLKNAIRMPLFFWHCTHYGLPAIWVQLASPKLVLEPRGSRFAKVLFRGCKSAIRYAKVLFRGCKSAIRYAKTQNRLSPLWAPSDLGSQKRNTYATFFLTLHSLWAPSDFCFAKMQNVSCRQGDGTHWLCFGLRPSD